MMTYIEPMQSNIYRYKSIMESKNILVKIFLYLIIFTIFSSFTANSEQILYGITGNAIEGRSLIRIDPLTGNSTLIGLVFFSPHGLADFDGKLYALGAGLDSIYQLDPNTGAIISSVPLDFDIGGEGALAIDSNGTGYTVSQEGFVSFNITTGVSTLISTERPPADGLDFDPISGKLVLLPDRGNGFAEVNIETGETTPLYIPDPFPDTNNRGGLTFRLDGELFFGGGQPGFIARLDKSTEQVVDIGNIGFAELRGLTFVETPTPATFIVNSIEDGEDSDLSDDICNDGTGFCTLRAAIQQANNSIGANAIHFNIPGSGPHTIQPTSSLPNIIDSITIDGYTQPGASSNTNNVGQGSNAILMIELDGSLAGSAGIGLQVSTDMNTIKGLVINRFNVSGITLDGVNAINNYIEGNFIGTDVSGTIALGNGNNTDNSRAIHLNNTASNNTIGGTSPASRNVISGNLGHGIFIAGGSNNAVQGNLLGVDTTGTTAIGNTLNGIVVFGQDNLIGGTVSGAQNVISGNGVGVTISGAGVISEGNLIESNLIGTDSLGMTAIGNVTDGVRLTGNVENNVVGGTALDAGNVISANGQHGIFINGAGAIGNIIQGNMIGTQISGNGDLGNTNFSIILNGGAHDNWIGGTATGAANTIAYGNKGVVIGVGINNAILSNAIFSHDSLGIDFSPSGVTPNDPGDGDNGANNLQNFPIITSASGNIITGTFNSTPDTTFLIELFTNNTCNASGHGDGEILIGSINITTDSNGNSSFSQATSPISAGDIITSTATDPNNNTSEFSQCYSVN